MRIGSPFRDWLPSYLIEFLDNLDLDGFYFDDTNWGSHEGRPFYPSCSTTIACGRLGFRLRRSTLR